MSDYKEHLTVEIVNLKEEDPQYTTIEDLIEYVPEDAEFEQYEYIEIEETPDLPETKIIENKWKNYQNKVTENVSEDSLVAIKAEGFINSEDKTLIIKLESDQHFQRDDRDHKFKCSNRKCKREEAVFDSQVELDRHNLLHLKQINANECPICNKILASQAKLNVHMETRHIPKIFTCDNCGKIFRSKDNLRLHMSHHRKHFLVECRACKKTYKSMQSLRYHLRQHFEHHQCETCGTVFEHKKLLFGHIAAKHNQELMLQCRFCKRMFSRNDVRETHEREIHKNGKVESYFKCAECECSFDLREELMNHKILNHYTGIIHTCTQCGKNFKKKSLLDMHMNSHKEKSIKCDVCKMMFTFVTGLAKHKKLNRCKGPPKKTHNELLTKEEIATIAKQQLLEITVNPTALKVEVDLITDITKVVQQEPVKEKNRPGRKKKLVSKDEITVGEYEIYPTIRPDSITKEELTTEPTKKMTDDVEPMKKSNIRVNKMGSFDLELHRQKTSDQVIYSSSGRMIKKKLPMMFPQLPMKPINILKKANVPFECDRCGFILDSKLRLISHLNSHIRGKKHQCMNCDRTFCNIVSLKKHCAMAHREKNPFKEKRFQCDQCPKRYLTSFLLGQHKLSHQNLKNQKCDLCPFATNAPYDLRNHIKRIHQASKDFVCPENDCGKAFKRRCDMENHRKSVHTNIKVYVKCPTCDVIILEKGLQSHMINRHSEKALERPFICSICGKSERYEKNLKRHYEAVHEPRDRGVIYQCPECPQMFYRRRELTAHSFEHFSGRIHQCDECGNKYKSKKELTNHLYSHRYIEWPCPICNVVFQTKSGRSKHLRKHKLAVEVTMVDANIEEDEEQFIIV